MKKDWKHRYFVAAVIVIAARPLIWEGPRARADEPTEWCLTNQNWVATAGSQGGGASGTCPTYGICDTPSVRNSWIRGDSTPWVTLRIKFHIVCADDRSHCTATLQNVADQMVNLNSDYAQYRIGFVENSETHFIYKTDYLLNPTLDDVNDMKWNNAEDPAHQINVFVTDPISDAGSFGTYPWALDSQGNRITLSKLGGVYMVAKQFGTGNSELTHEIGHNLGLYHTQRGVSELRSSPDPCSEANVCDCPCYERANGIDADVTGDFASDTPPTPTNTLCHSPGGSDPCSCEPPNPCTPWGQTEFHNYMGYGVFEDPHDCWHQPQGHFTDQQVGRMHCWIADILTSWIACTTDEACEDLNVCTQNLCAEGRCQNTNETPGITCHDGIDNDCDGYADCDDVDCADDPGCRCYDNGGNSPLVCVKWAGGALPFPEQDFRIDFETDPNNPGLTLPTVTFWTGNNGWRVWSQKSRTDSAPGNLGNIKIDPTLPTADFGVTVAHGASPGAVNVASISLVKTGWTGQSNLSGGSIAGDLGGLVLQESEGQGGAASLTIAGNLDGYVYIPKVDRFEVNGSVSGRSLIRLGEFVGEKRVEFNTTPGANFAGWLSLLNGIPSNAAVTVHGLLADTAWIDLNGQELAGALSLYSGTASGSAITGGTLSGILNLEDGAYAGDTSFSSVESSRGIAMLDSTFSGKVFVAGNYNGAFVLSSGVFAPEGVLEIYGNVDIGAYISNLDGPINGAIAVYGTMNGNICGDNLHPRQPLPSNIHIGRFGPNATICGDLVCPGAVASEPNGVDKNRFISFVPPAADTGEYAIQVVLTSLHHPNPPYTGGEAADFSACEGQARWVGQPTQFVESASSGTPFYAAFLCKGTGFCCGGSRDGLACDNVQTFCPGGGYCGDGPFYSTEWGNYGLIHVTGSAIVPSSEYTVQVVPAAGAACVSSLAVRTTRWGDVVEPFNSPTNPQPDVGDISALVDKFKSTYGAPIKARAKLAALNARGEIDIAPDLDFAHISACADAFKGLPYPYSIRNCP